MGEQLAHHGKFMLIGVWYEPPTKCDVIQARDKLCVRARSGAERNTLI